MAGSGSGVLSPASLFVGLCENKIRILALYGRGNDHEPFKQILAVRGMSLNISMKILFVLLIGFLVMPFAGTPLE